VNGVLDRTLRIGHTIGLGREDPTQACSGSNDVYAIIADGGRQYRVQPGDVIDVDIRELPDEADTLVFDRVLMVGSGADATIGTPTVEGAAVTAKLVEAVKGPKLDVIKFRRRKQYRRKIGHRQRYLRVRIDEVQGV